MAQANMTEKVAMETTITAYPAEGKTVDDLVAELTEMGQDIVSISADSVTLVYKKEGVLYG